MKKITLIAAAAITAMAVSATDYNVDPKTSVVLKNGGKFIVDYITLSEASIAEFQKAGCTVNYVGPDAEAGRNLWYWEETFLAGDESNPRVNMDEGGYVSLVVGTKGWSGAGFAIAEPGVNLSHFNDNTRFHIAYCTPSGNAPVSVALIILDGESNGSVPAKVALGTAFDDGGKVYPPVGDALNEDWNGLDISFSDLKKFYPSFTPANLAAWQGNILSILGGGVEGKTLAFDAIYYYTPAGENSIKDVEAEEAAFVVTENTINVMGGQGIVLYNLAGQTVKATAGSVLGINNLPAGVYVARSGNKAQKVLVK